MVLMRSSSLRHSRAEPPLMFSSSISFMRFVLFFIFEFKVDKPAREALQQIEDKGYAAPFASDSRQVFKIGVSFDSSQRSLAEWLVNV